MKINYKSDFEITYSLVDNEGNQLPIPDNKWKLVLSVGNPTIGNNRKYVASYDGSAYKNCSVEDNVIHVYADSHCLSCGVLWATFIDYQDNQDFADGDKRIYAPVPTDIELVSGKGDDATEAVIEVIASYILRDAYDIAVAAGYNGTREAYYDALRNLPNDTNAARHQINELIAGKEMIAQALSDRGYPTDATESSAAMAQKIENMSYDAGWLAQLGYSENNDGCVKEAVEYSKQKKIAWENGAINNFKNDYDLAYCPMIDTSSITNMAGFFSSCSRLVFVPLLDTSNVTTMNAMFESCSQLRTIPQFDFSKVTDCFRMFANFPASRNFKLPKMNTGRCIDLRLGFHGLSSVYVTDIDVGAATNLGISNSCQYAIIRNLGKVTTGSFWELPTDWGLGSEENNESLQTSIGDLSYDRISAGLEATAIKIKSACFNRLTAETIAKATDKGITLTVV